MRGCIFKRGKRWVSVIYLGKDEHGRKDQNWESHDTRAEAEEYVARFLAARAEGRGILPGRRQRLAEFLERWLQSQRQLAPSTQRNYALGFHKHVDPQLGHVVIQELTPLHVQTWIGQLQKRYSEVYVFNLYSRLRIALGDAVELGLIAHNPAEHHGRRRSFLKMPRGPEPAILDHEQLRLFLAYLRRRSAHWFLFTLAVHTGLRRGELLGLQRSDVTWGMRAMLTIRQAAREEAGGVALGPTKTRSGRRAVKLTRELTLQLKAYLDQQDRAAIAAGRTPTGDALVFARPDGRPWYPGSISDHFKRHRERFTQRHIRLHDLRHTHASQLLADRVPIKVVQERLGHSRASYTLDKYVHTVPTIQDEAIVALERRETRRPAVQLR